jgi:peptidyl-prolyl cis-trans isomerase C
MAKLTRFLAGLALSALLSAPALAEGAGADTPVATVNGTVITLGHMIALRETLPEQYKSLPNDVLFKGILDQLIQQTVLQQSLGDKIAKRDALQVENERRGYLSNVALQSVVAGAVTEESLQAAYDARFKSAEPTTEYNAAHILVATEDLAKSLQAQIEGGADFAALAKANSTDTGSGANGGDLGWFGQGTMVKPFEDAVKTAVVGKVTAPVKTDFGWHLILVKETRIASAPPLDDLRDELAGEIEQKVVAAHIKTLTDAATVTRTDEGIDPGLLTDLTLLDK